MAAREAVEQERGKVPPRDDHDHYHDHDDYDSDDDDDHAHDHDEDDNFEPTCGFSRGGVEADQDLNLPTSQGGRQATESPTKNHICVRQDIIPQNRGHLLNVTDSVRDIY